MNHWEQFARERLEKIFTDKETIIDIGGSLRLDRSRGNIENDSHAWLRPLVEKKKYLILDPVPDYHPDIVGDIHALPMEADSQEAILCIAVLEHVHNPIVAVEEMYRVLKPGGYLFVYVPFLYPYHASPGYYGDYWRFTEDAMRLLFKPFSTIELVNNRGAIETWWYLTPLRAIPGSQKCAGFLDRLARKTRTKQASGYTLFAIK